MMISIDGNSIGKKLESFIFSNNMDGLKDFSNSITEYIENISQTIIKCNGKIYMAGGDNILAWVDDSKLSMALENIQKISPPANTIFSIGLGSSAQLSYLALAHRKVLPQKTSFATMGVIDNERIIFREFMS